MIRFVLFDLDNTLADSLHLKCLRDQRGWAEVYTKIQSAAAFEGISQVWTELRQREVYLAVVTHSPATYARRLLAHLCLAPDLLVAYHDLKGRRKPHPYGYQIGSQGHPASDGVAVGDDVNDLLAANAFGCKGMFAGWSREPTLTADACKNAGWGYLETPLDLIAAIDDLP
jgi:phosphoglycolate phosphatase-like HAD superfamily hydrolase